MWHGLTGAEVPSWSPQPAGLAAQLAARLRHRRDLPGPRRRAGGRLPGDQRRPIPRARRTALVLADRAQVIRGEAERAYPLTRTARITYSGTGYRDGYAKGQQADIGAGRVNRGRGRALTGARG